MFDLINAQAEYQTHTKLLMKSSFNPQISTSILSYLELDESLECFKIGRFVSLDSPVAVYCEWLYQYHKLSNDYDVFFELFTNAHLPNIANEEDHIKAAYHKEFYTSIWPKVLVSFKNNLNISKEDIIKKYPYFENILNNIDNHVNDYYAQSSLSTYIDYSKTSFLPKAKYSLSYLKIGLPIFLGYKKDILSAKLLNPDSVNWQSLQEFLMTLCLIHQISNDDKIIKLIKAREFETSRRFEIVYQRSKTPTLEKRRILDSFYAKAKNDLANLNLLEKQISTLDNLLNWAYDYQDSSYEQLALEGK